MRQTSLSAREKKTTDASIDRPRPDPDLFPELVWNCKTGGYDVY